MSTYTVDEEGNLCISPGINIGNLNPSENEYLRNMESNSFVFDMDDFFRGLMRMFDLQYYNAVFYAHWIYYVKERPMVQELQHVHKLYGLSYDQLFLLINMLGLDSWTKDTCAHMEHLSLLEEPVPLGDPRMNMAPLGS